MEAILATLPSLGELFPSLANARPGDRALGDYPILIRDTPLVFILVSALCGSVFNPRLEIGG